MSNIGQTPAETIAIADAAIRAAMTVAQRDPFRPECHFRPPANWMNDICGALWHEGWYHIFYQFNPFADRCNWSCVNSCWGHARSRGLVHWEHLPIAVAPSVGEGNYQCASGSATHRADGTPMLFYGHTPLLTALDIGHVVYDKGGKRTVICISGGFCEVAPDHILILARTAETLEMIDRARAEAARNRAQKRLEEKGAVSIDEERARLALLRALNRLGAVDMS